jgi:hypothetical protein
MVRTENPAYGSILIVIFLAQFESKGQRSAP